MQILYISALSSEQLIDEIHNQTGKNPGYAVQKFSRLLVNGLLANGADVTALSNPPITRSNSSSCYVNYGKVVENDIQYCFIPFINAPVLKHLCVFFHSFFYVLFWGILGNNYLKLLLRIIFLILLSKRIASIDAIGKFQFFLFETTVVLSLFLDLFKGSSNINGIIEQIPLFFYVMIFLLDGKSLMKVGNYLTTIVSIVFIASLISYLGSIIGFTPQLGTIEHYSQNRSYVHYPFFLFEVGELSLRFYGIYDEPGQLGTISALLLCANSFNFKDWRTWILLTSGILSLSLFFT